MKSTCLKCKVPKLRISGEQEIRMLVVLCPPQQAGYLQNRVSGKTIAALQKLRSESLIS
jgi:hypothetical protein